MYFSHHQVFQRVLKAYATKLLARLPKGGSGFVAAATGMDGQIKVLKSSIEFLFPSMRIIIIIILSYSKCVVKVVDRLLTRMKKLSVT